MTLDIYTCDAVVFQSVTDSDLYILGSYKDQTLTIEIPKDIISIYGVEGISIGSRVFQYQPEDNTYTLNIEWQYINDSIRFSTLNKDRLYLKSFEPVYKSMWGQYDPSIQIFHESTYRSTLFKDVKSNLYSITPVVLQNMNTLPIMDLSIYLAAINCLLLNESPQLELSDWYYIKSSLINIRNKKGLSLFYHDCIEDFLNLCNRKIEKF